MSKQADEEGMAWLHERVAFLEKVAGQASKFLDIRPAYKNTRDREFPEVVEGEDTSMYSTDVPELAQYLKEKQ